jgi:hypothetical protein
MHPSFIRRATLLTAVGICLVQAQAAPQAVQTLRLAWAEPSTPLVTSAAAVFARQVAARCNATVRTNGTAPLTITLVLDPALPAESYEITNSGTNNLRVIGADQRGLLYGLGKLLRDSRYGPGGFTPGAGRGRSTPDCSFRALYAATHFMNFYEAAPLEEVRVCVEDLALWGVNTVIAHFPTWNFQGFEDPAARRHLDRLRSLFQAAKSLGLQVGLVQCPNQGFSNAPVELRARPFPDPLGRRGNFGVNCCPASPAGQKYLANLYGRLFAEFADTGLDYLVLWPYDEGGCGCAECWPWGARGFPTLSWQITAAGRSRFPALKSVLSTWVYDTPPAGEWAGLSEALAAQPKWLDFLLADSHTDFPRYPLEQRVPGNLPLVNFPEISMWGRSPWGGYGANPLPRRLGQLWRQTQGKLAGGMPYSEGVYEDLNKAICYQLYWRKDRSPESIVREYLAFEYSPGAVDDLWKAVCLLEDTWPERGTKSAEALRLLQGVAPGLTAQTQKSWRWRILLLRAQIDNELAQRNGRLEGEVLKASFNELTRLYHAEHAHSMPVQPPRVP